MITHELSNEQYHASEGVSSSDVKAVLTSTLFHWKNKRFTTSTAMELGTAVHSMLLEPELDEVVRGPESRRGNAWKDAHEECRASGKTLLTEADYDACEDMSVAMMANPTCAKILADKSAVKEASIFADCPRTGLKLRCRPDIYVPSTGVMGDVKTTRDASPREFARQTYNLRYDVQAAFYKYVAELGTDWKVRHFAFLAVENSAPYATCLHSLSMEAMEIGREHMFRALDEIAEAKRSDQYSTGWPSFNMIHPPTWMVED